MRLVQEMSEMCTRPSMPSSIPMKMPKSVMFLILPSMVVPTGYFSAITSQGLGAACFMPREIRRASGLMSRTTASTLSPTETTLEGWRTLRVQDISET